MGVVRTNAGGGALLLENEALKNQLAAQKAAVMSEFKVTVRPFYSAKDGVTYEGAFGGKFAPLTDQSKWITSSQAGKKWSITFKKDCLLRLYLPQSIRKTSVTYGAGGSVKCTLKDRVLFAMTITDSNSPPSVYLPEQVEYVSVGDTLALEVTNFYYGRDVGSFTVTSEDTKGYMILLEKVI